MNHKQIIKEVSKYYRIKESELFIKSHKPEIVERKHMVRKLLREQRYTLHQIGNFTNCSHDNALHGIRQAQNLIDTCKYFKEDYNSLKVIIDKKGMTLWELAECWTKRIERLKYMNSWESACVLMKMEQRMVDILDWSKRFGITC